MIGPFLRYGYNAFSSRYFKKYLKAQQKGIDGAREVLLRILKDAESTEYGRIHHFSEVTDPVSYAATVPLVQYSDLAPYIARQENGESNILTREDPIYFALSSGTTGNQKVVPMTPSSMRDINMAMMVLHQGAENHLLPRTGVPGRSLMIMSSGTDSSRSGAGTSGGMAKMKPMIPLFWTTPPEAFDLSDVPTANYLHLLFALQEKSLESMAAPFAPAIAALFHTLSTRWDQLIADIAYGTLQKDLKLTPEQRDALKKRLQANPARALELNRLKQLGMQGIIGRIFPRLRVINTVISGDFSMYEAALRYYIGPEIPIFSGIYGASEVQVGIGIALNQPAYMLCTHIAYFEFIPEAHLFDPEPPTRLMTEVEVGKRYEVVITTTSGFYRYRLGDVVEIKGFYKETPVVTFGYRIGTLCNLTGEKTTDDALFQALRNTLLTYERPLLDYTSTGDTTGDMPSYRIIIQSDRSLPKTFAATLDHQLTLANPRYGAAREAGKLGLCRCDAVSGELFAAFRAKRLQEGASINQFKMPRHLTREDAVHFISR